MMCGGGLAWTIQKAAHFPGAEAGALLPKQDAAQQAAPRATDTKPFEMTVLCKFYAKGRCRRGPDCTFAHSEAELQPPPNYFKSRLCESFATFGACSSGDKCRFAHGNEELRRPVVQRKRKSAREGDAAPQQTRKARLSRAPEVAPQRPHPRGRAPEAVPPLSQEPQEPQQLQGSMEAAVAALRAEAAKLQQQIQNLCAVRAGGAVLPTTSAECFESDLGAAHAGATYSKSVGKLVIDSWSRQSTEEGPGAANSMGFQASFAGEWADELDDESSSESEVTFAQEGAGWKQADQVVENVADEDEEEVDVDLFVKNTFVNLAPRSRPSRPARAASAPPSGRTVAIGE